MEKFGFMEPCCIENALPRLLRQYGLVTWQSNGDITFDKILKAVAHMAGNNVRITIVVPEIDIPMLRYLRWYHQRGWLKGLSILTQKSQKELIRSEMPEELELTIRSHKSVTEGMVIVMGEKNTVVVQGSLHSVVTPALENYTTYCGNDTDRIAMLTNVVLSRLRVLAKKEETVPVEDTASVEKETKEPSSAEE